jgi:hypothetical protein
MGKRIEPPAISTIKKTMEFEISIAAALRVWKVILSKRRHKKVYENAVVTDALLAQPEFRKLHVKIQHMPPEHVEAYIRACLEADGGES